MNKRSRPLLIGALLILSAVLGILIFRLTRPNPVPEILDGPGSYVEIVIGEITAIEEQDDGLLSVTVLTDPGYSIANSPNCMILIDPSSLDPEEPDFQIGDRIRARCPGGVSYPEEPPVIRAPYYVSHEESSSGTEETGVSAPETETASSETTVPAEILSPEETPLNFTWDPCRYSGFYRDMLPAGFEDDYEKMITAILNREGSFTCTLPFFEQIPAILSVCFPCYAGVVMWDCWNIDENDTSDEPLGTVALTYQLSPEEQEQLLSDFGDRVEQLITESVRESDTPTMAAIAVYQRFCSELTYDYEAADDTSEYDVSPYRAIMESAGICQSFAGGYAHLCVQLGIPAGTTGGLSENLDAHEWTQLKLDGVYYYADPTWQGNTGLEWFGFTSRSRAENDGYPEDLQNIGDLNLARADQMPVGDDRFAEFRDLFCDPVLIRKDGTMIIEAVDAEGATVSVTVR